MTASSSLGLKPADDVPVLDSGPEIWVPIPGATGGHEVSSHGRVRTASGRILQGTRSAPFPTVTIVDGFGVAHSYPVVDLVASAFLFGSVHSIFCRHRDGDVANTHPENLECVNRGSPPQIADAVFQYFGVRGLAYLGDVVMGRLACEDPDKFLECFKQFQRKADKIKQLQVATDTNKPNTTLQTGTAANLDS